MRLTNEFPVPKPIDDVWALLLDLERVIPCMPGAALLGRDGDQVKGSLRVKVGPIGANFTGVARFVEVDPDSRRTVIAAEGDDPKGGTSARATIKVELTPAGIGRTQVKVETDLTLTGKLAQFGRGAMVDISTRLIGQFTRNLEAELGASSGAAESPDRPLGKALSVGDLMSVAGPTVMKCVGPVAFILFLVVVLSRKLRHTR